MSEKFKTLKHRLVDAIEAAISDIDVVKMEITSLEVQRIGRGEILLAVRTEEGRIRRHFTVKVSEPV